MYSMKWIICLEDLFRQDNILRINTLKHLYYYSDFGILYRFSDDAIWQERDTKGEYDVSLCYRQSILKESYSVCADTVNQLVQKLKSYGIQSSMSVVGSKKYDLITQNEKEPIDYDFNLWIESAENIMSDPRQLKCTIMEAFNEVLRHKGWGTCNDSTSALTTKKQVLDRKKQNTF